jgi:hypothetical protein
MLANLRFDGFVRDGASILCDEDKRRRARFTFARQRTILETLLTACSVLKPFALSVDTISHVLTKH